jgi:hypothetical protein
MAVRTIRSAAIALVAMLALALPAVAERAAKKNVAPPPPPQTIVVVAQPVASFDHRDKERRRFGFLEFRGGLVLTSPFREFGGISSISVAPDGTNFIAASDRGWWLRGRIVYSGTRPTGIADAEMAPILGLAQRRWYDSEAIARDGGTVYVGLERVHRIVRFNFGRDGLLARAEPIALPGAFRSLPSNGGIEALAFVPRKTPLGGTLIAIAERGRDAAGNHLGFLIGGPRPGAFTITRKNDYDISDATLLPGGGDLVVLERKFGWTTGLFVRIRRIPIAELRPGALVDGPILFEADLGQQIDNLEGISAHRSDGETVLTLISDDNFSPLQRTLLLQFKLVEP